MKLRKLKRREKVGEFLDYGGDELFSQLNKRGIGRGEARDRLIELLKNYSDSCSRIRGRSAAYRFMLKRASRNGWLGSGSGDLRSHRLTEEEREFIADSLDGYISSGGSRARRFKKLLMIAAGVIVAALAVWAAVSYLTSEEFEKMMYHALSAAAREGR